MGDIDFEEQLELERLEREKKEKLDPENHPREKVDPDGTRYEWDIEKKAWFPKIDANFIAQYQMNYGPDGNPTGEEAGAQGDDKQQQFLQSYYDATVQEEQFLSKRWKEVVKEDTHDEAVAKLDKLEKDIQDGVLDDTQTDSKETMEKYTEEQKKEYNDYWSYYYGTDYYDYYSDCLAAYDAETNKGKTTDGGEDGKKKGKKRKPAAPQREEGWFQMEEKDNTNVYVSGLPLDITEEEFTEMMNKYGLIMNDPRTRKPKLKLYIDEQGQPKGDGRCCYIKRESVDLVLNLLDGLELRGKTVKAELASFNMKGDFDPTKKKKKLTNKEKRRLKERQQKLFDWRPDAPRFARAKHEKVVILKNVFDSKDFETDPLKINTVRNNIRSECSKYGEVKKTVVHDRHEDGVVSVHFKEAEEADLCIESMNQRYLATRRLTAAQWDGQTKYDVVETEEEKAKRLKQWADFLETGGEGESSTKSDKQAAPQQDSSDTMETAAGTVIGAGDTGGDQSVDTAEKVSVTQQDQSVDTAEKVSASQQDQSVDTAENVSASQQDQSVDTAENVSASQQDQSVDTAENVSATQQDQSVDTAENVSASQQDQSVDTAENVSATQQDLSAVRDSETGGEDVDRNDTAEMEVTAEDQKDTVKVTDNVEARTEETVGTDGTGD